MYLIEGLELTDCPEEKGSIFVAISGAFWKLPLPHSTQMPVELPTLGDRRRRGKGPLPWPSSQFRRDWQQRIIVEF